MPDAHEASREDARPDRSQLPRRLCALLAMAACLWSPLAAAAAEAPRGTLTSTKLKWQVRRTAAERAAAHQAADATVSDSAAQAEATAPKAMRSTQARPLAAQALPRPQRTGAVIQASDEKFDPFKDPFEDDVVPAGPQHDPVQTISQPTTSGPATSEPSTSEPATSEPPIGEPATSEPAAGAPSLDEPPIGEPAPLPSATEQPAPTYDEPPPYRSDSDPFTRDSQPSYLDDNAPVVPGTAPPRGRMSCDDYKSECRTAIETLRQRDITKIEFGVIIESDEGNAPIEGRDYPCECLLGLNTTFPDRHWAPTTFTWKASSLCHKPLYFEDVQLERYGHSWNPVVQPFASAAHFFVSVPLLPYKMGLNPPCECMYTLGYYRPGSCAPYMIEPIPLSLRGAAFEALGAVAFGFWFWPSPNAP